MLTKDGAKTFNLRIPVELREWLDAAARKNMRSLNAEILYRLAEAKAADSSKETAGQQQN
jgi:predicted HicB family RNase H-like nuclease